MIPEIEKKSQEQIKTYQEERLQELAGYVFANSKYYRSVFINNNLSPSDIKTIEDLTKLPVTTKNQLQEFNQDFLCVPRTKIIDYVTTSGTLGEPVSFAMTDSDLNRLAYNESISLATAGVKSSDTIQLMTTMDRRFMAGLAYFLGSRELGSAIIRVGAGIPELQWDSIHKFKPSYIIAVPSFLLKLIDYAKQNNINLNDSAIKGAICIGEPLRNQDFSPTTLTAKIKSAWDIELYSTYASTEMSTAFTECKNRQGGHYHPELVILELLDDENQPVAKDQIGEVTITTLGIEGMPLLRYKTGDMARLHTAVCGCGRNTSRLGPIAGRKQQMIKYKGTTLYPTSIINVLNDFKEIKNYVIEISKSEVGTDFLLVKVSTFKTEEKLLQKLKENFRAKLRVVPEIMFLNNDEIKILKFKKQQRKPIVVIDNR